MRRLMIILLALTTLSSCKKYEPDFVMPDETPIFRFSGEINGVETMISTSATHYAASSFGEDSIGVIYYEGALLTCEDCPSGFSMRWRENNPDFPSLENTVSSSSPELRYLWKPKTTNFFDVTLNAKTYGVAGSISWKLMDNTYAGQTVHFSVEENPNMTFVPVELIVNYDSGCTAILNDTVYLPNHGCDCEVKSEFISPGIVRYLAAAEGSTNFKYQWQFSDGTRATSEEVEFYYGTAPSNDVEEVQLKVSTDQCSMTRNHQYKYDAGGCAANMSYDIATRQLVDGYDLDPGLGTIEIVYIDETGSVFNSALSKQPMWSSLEISEVETYRDNVIQPLERSMKVEATVNCLLSNGVDSILLRNGQFTLPIGLGAD